MLDRELLQTWVSTYLPATLQADQVALEPVSGDAGFREYFRINSAPPMVVAYAPPQFENNEGFVRIGLALARVGVHVPRVYAVDFQQGYLLQEDLGKQLYLQSLCQAASDSQVADLYDYAEAALLNIQNTPADEGIFPLFSAERLREEMALFPHWFIGELLGDSISAGERAMLDSLFDGLVDNALEQPQVVVHRDFHSRNLLVLPDEQVGVIDFQDAVVGPFTYDLVSLLRDCYIRWPESMVKRRVEGFLVKARAAGLVAEGIDEQQYLQWFDLMGLQRHIKVLGIFARLCLRDGKSTYLNNLPLVIRYTLEVAQRYPQTRAFYEWFDARLSEPLMEQSWYRDWRTATDE